MGFQIGNEGQLARTVILATDLQPDTARLYAAVIASLIRPQRPGPLWGVRLWLRTEAPGSVTLVPAEFCPPVDISPPAAPIRRVEIVRANEPRQATRPIQLRILVNSQGRVAAVELIRSTGLADLDEEIMANARRRRFRPAQLDGVAVEAWVTIP